MKFVAFLRGINVGGKTKVPMSELKALLEGLGLKDVKTLLNSGNVVFETDGAKDSLANKIEAALESKFGFKIAVILRTKPEIEKTINSKPFKNSQENKDVRFYVTFTPEKELFNTVDLSREGTTDLMAKIDKEYGKTATTRNWNTVLKIAGL